MNKEQLELVAIFEQRTPRQLAVDLVTVQEQRDALADQVVLLNQNVAELRRQNAMLRLGTSIASVEGWQLVPVQLTPEMWDAMNAGYQSPACSWRAALSSAPSPEAAQ